MTRGIDGRVAIVTGGGAGIGRAVALRLAQAGARTVVVDKVPAAGLETLAQLQAQGGQGIFIEADTSSRDDVAAMVEEVRKAYGEIHILLNNAGVGIAKPAHEMVEAEWDHVIQVTLKSVFLCCQAVIPVMLEQGGGSIVNTASVLGLVASPHQPAYCAAMGGVVMLTKQMAVDFASQGIRVNCVCPSVIENSGHEELLAMEHVADASAQSVLSRHPMNRLGTPEEVAEAVLWLSSDAASFITGVALPVDGGYVAW